MSTMSDLSVQVIEAVADDLVYLVAEQGKDMPQAVEIVTPRTCLSDAGMETAVKLCFP